MVKSNWESQIEAYNERPWDIERSRLLFILLLNLGPLLRSGQHMLVLQHEDKQAEQLKLIEICREEEVDETQLAYV